MHSITAVFDKKYFCGTNLSDLKSAWAKQRPYTNEEKKKKLNFTQGYYIFGG